MSSGGGKRKPPSPGASHRRCPAATGPSALSGVDRVRRESSSEDDATVGDYEGVGSPGSSASGPVYVRTPGFQQHGQAVLRPPEPRSVCRTLPSAALTCKKKKSSTTGLICVREMGSLQQEGGGVRVKTRREPLPMKLRALPHSFWQQPNHASEVSPAAVVVPLLPPLFKQDSAAEGISEVRPVSPPSLQCISGLTTSGSAHSSPDTPSPPGSRIIRVSNADLLLKLFDSIDDRSRQCTIVKRGRPKKAASSTVGRPSTRGDDPCLSSAGAEGLLPLLNLQQDKGRTGTVVTPHQTLTLVSFRDGDKSVSLPALNVEHNYSQMLSELVIKL